MDSLIYLFCLCAGLVFTILTFVLGHFMGGGDHGHMDGSGGHAEAGVDSSDMPGVSALSPTVIATFITAFGGLGTIFSRVPGTRNPWVSAPLSVLGASALAGVMLWILRQIFNHTQGSSESKVSTVIGLDAMIVSPIPADGVGEIAYVQAGTRYTAPAREETGQAVAAGRPVRITRVIGSQFYVVPAKPAAS